MPTERVGFGSIAGLQAVAGAFCAAVVQNLLSRSAYTPTPLAAYEQQVKQEANELQEQNRWLLQESKRLKGLHAGRAHAYEAVTASVGHELPELYGEIKEKTIWSYWFHPESCPESTNCTLPAHIKLCTETVERHKGTFDYRVVYADQVSRYVNRFELPVSWQTLRPAQQKDALMNALLARYGGIAFDISIILLRPLDEYWEEMLARGATFSGFLYRANGKPWNHAEAMAVWFLMSRREGLFSAAVRNQVIGMGDRKNTRAYHQWYLALGDQTLLPLVSMFNYSLPKCYEDQTVPHRWACPEHEMPPWYKGITGPPRNDTVLLLRDPRDGPQLPMALSGMVLWNVSNATEPVHPDNNGPGFPMHDAGCESMKSCWEDVFLKRYNARPKPGETHIMSYVKIFQHGKPLIGRSRQQLLTDTDTYFYQWLKLAGLPEAK